MKRLTLFLLLLLLPSLVVAQRADSYARCINISSDNGTTTTCLCQENSPTDRIFHDTNCDRTKDVGEEYLDASGGAESNDLEAIVGSIQTNEIFVGSGASAGTYIAIAACAADEKIEYTDGAPNTFTCEAIGSLVDADITFTSPAIAAATATTPSVDDDDTSVATTAFVQDETVAAGDVTGTLSSGLTIGADTVEESMLKAVDAAGDEECLTYESTVGDFEWEACGGAETNDLESVATSAGDAEIFVGTGVDAGAYIAGLAACAADEKIEYVPGSPDTFTCEAIGSLVDADVGDITLGTGTAGDFVGTLTAGDGIVSSGATTGEDIDHTIDVDLNATEDSVGSTSNLSGLEFTATGELALLQGCTDEWVMKWEETGGFWTCAADAGGAEVNDLEGTAPTAILDDEMYMGSGAGAGAFIAMPTGGTNGCDGAGEALQYNTSTNSWDCLTGLGAGGTVDSIVGDDNANATTGTALSVDGDATGIDTDSDGANTLTISFDGTEVATETWGAAGAIAWTFDAGATDPLFTWTSDTLTITNMATLTASGTDADFDAVTATSFTADPSATPGIDFEDSTNADSDVDVAIDVVDNASNDAQFTVGVEIAGTMDTWLDLDGTTNAITLGDPSNVSSITLDTSVTGSAGLVLDAGAIDSTEILDDSILEVDLKAVNVAIDEDILTYESTTGDYEWHTPAELSLQPLDTELTLIAGLAETSGNVMFAAGSAWTSDPTPAIACDDCTANTESPDNNTTQLATTAFVQAETVAAGDVTGTIGGGLTIGVGVVDEDMLAADLVFDAGDLLNFTSVDPATALAGIYLPQQAGACVGAIEEGSICWDSTNDNLYVGDGAAPQQMNGGAADGVGYDEVLEEAAGLTKRAQLNFIGASVTCVDNGGATRTDCTFTDADTLGADGDKGDITVGGSGTTLAIDVGAVIEDDLAASLAFDDADLLTFAAGSVNTATEGILLPGHATSCSSATGEGQVCIDRDDDSTTLLWIGDGTTARNIGAAGGFASFDVQGDDGAPNTVINDGNTLVVSGGNAITTEDGDAGADTLSIAVTANSIDQDELAASISLPTGDSFRLTGTASLEATLLTVPATTSTGTIAVDQAVYVSTWAVSEDCVELELADADSAATMPAVGLVSATLTDGDCNGEVTLSGAFVGSAGAVSPNDPLYVSTTAGALTTTKPTGSALIQKLATATREAGASDEIEIFGAGRTNDVPNIASANFWLGNGSGVATAVAMSGDVSMDNAGLTSVDNTKCTGSTEYLDGTGTCDDISSVYAPFAIDADEIVGDTVDDDDLDVAAGGTGVSTLTDGGILIGNGSGDLVALGEATNGQIPIGDGTTDPVLATITGGEGITVTNGAGTITVDAETHTECFTLFDVDDIAATNDIPSVWEAPAAVTVTMIACESDVAMTINLEKDDSCNTAAMSATSIESGDLICGTTMTDGTIDGANDNLADGDCVDLNVVSTTTAERVTICMEYTFD